MIIRDVCDVDMANLADLLNEIIRRGGTTAMTEPVSAEELADYKAHFAHRNSWLLAEDKQRLALGFQYLEPQDDLPACAADIATFVRIGYSGRGIGRGLLKKSCLRARKLGFTWINATIRCDNERGLSFYRGQGFRDYKEASTLTLPSGQSVERVSTRLYLT